MPLEEIESHRCFGGTLTWYRHHAATTGCPMTFTAFVPPQAADGNRPVLWWLSGLTCTAENFTSKAGAYRKAAELGLIIVAPDTSPRGETVPDDPEGAYDFGLGAGFYLDATQEPWALQYRMASYVTSELPQSVFAELPGDRSRQGLFGHSMGGHGALTLGLKNPGTYRSLSAFAPICAPSQVPWGEKAFSGYLGDNRDDWSRHDATALMRAAGDRSEYPPILIDQGTADGFLEDQLRPDLFEAACGEAGQRLTLRMQEGYDHSYFFIASFIDDHLEHHARILAG
jgi:S-formylglutathione hydrolase